jgi:hypothetical protein
VNTVANNQSSYTKRDFSRAELARKIQKMMGCPSTCDFLRYVDNNLLPNCPINRQDILAAEHIFVPDVGALKGKTVRQSPNRVRILRNPESGVQRNPSVELLTSLWGVRAQKKPYV